MAATSEPKRTATKAAGGPVTRKRPAAVQAAPRKPVGGLTKDGASRAYLQVADELRRDITSGVSQPGERLGSEGVLAERFGVSRSTIREALRVLASQRLIATTRGATGGSTVLRFEQDDAMQILKESIDALTRAEGCTELEMEEVRELLEVSAAWWAAARRTPADVVALRALIPKDPGSTPVAEMVEMNKQFHYRILAASGNRLLHILAEPVAVLLESAFASREYGPDYWELVNDDHRRIVYAIECRDQVETRIQFSRHVKNLRAMTRELPTRSTLGGLSFDLDG